MHFAVMVVGGVANLLAAALASMCVVKIIQMDMFDTGMDLMTDALISGDSELFEIDRVSIKQFSIMCAGLSEVFGYIELAVMLESLGSVADKCSSQEKQILEIRELAKVYKPIRENNRETRVFLYILMLLGLVEMVTACILLYGGNLKNRYFFVPWFAVNWAIFFFTAYAHFHLWSYSLHMAGFLLYFICVPFRVIGGATIGVIYFKDDL